MRTRFRTGRTPIISGLGERRPPGCLALGILLALYAESVTQLVLGSVKVIGLLGAAFWLGVVWRRATAAGVWASFIGSLCVWALMSAPANAGVAADAISIAAQLLRVRRLSPRPSASRNKF